MIYSKSIPIEKGVRTSIKMNLEEFKKILSKKLFKALIKSKNYTKEDAEECLEDDWAKYIYELVEIGKDCSIIFDTENISSEEEALIIAEGEGSLSDILGFHEEKGFCWLGINAGGDWEYPVFFIVYYDGKEFRAYSPKVGNVFNINNNEAVRNNDSDLEDSEASVKLLKEDFLSAIEIDKISIIDK